MSFTISSHQKVPTRAHQFYNAPLLGSGKALNVLPIHRLQPKLTNRSAFADMHMRGFVGILPREYQEPVAISAEESRAHSCPNVLR